MHDHILTNVGIYGELYGPSMPEPDISSFPASPDEPVKIENLNYLNHGYLIHSKDNWDLNDESLMAAEVSDFKTGGGSAILECSAPGIRGDIEGLRRISRETGVHIIASTGLYAEESWSETYAHMSGAEFENYMMREINEGIEGTNIKAGQIKTAVNHFSEKGKVFLEAAARVSKKTGLLVTIHTGNPTSDEERRLIMKTFQDAGANTSQLLFCHIQLTFTERNLETVLLHPESWTLNLDQAKKILDQGANISIDLFGSPYDLEVIGDLQISDQVKMAGLIALIKAGYSDQIVIGTYVFMKNMTRRFGGAGYCRLLNFVVPTLRMVGIAESDIQKITIDNPARLLAF